MVINIQDDISRLHALGLLNRLLADKTTKRHIIWATAAYSALGRGYGRGDEITARRITGAHSGIVKSRAQKELDQQAQRTRQRAEVFTPLSVCRNMNDWADELCFGHSDPSQTEDWKGYVGARRLEITCGEGPYLASRYDAQSGEAIPIPERTGLLDRTLRTVGEHTETEEQWMAWAIRALQGVYGYEVQGDSLLIARINLLATFEDHLLARWGRAPTPAEYQTLIRIITWNLWQMDGLTGRPPCEGAADGLPSCRIFNWRGRYSVEYPPAARKKGRSMGFDLIIGNPPYQDETLGENKGFAPPIYHRFLEQAYGIADVVEMIHPARFLFNAGSTPKQWNRQMLDDPHLKVLDYQRDAGAIFPNTEIKGGVAVTYRDKRRDFGPIQVFSPYQELNAVRDKAAPREEAESLAHIIYIQNRFDLEALYQAHPEYQSVIGSGGRDKRFRNNIFEKIPLFSAECQNDGDIAVIGVVKNKRQWRYLPAAFTDTRHENLFKWKVLVVRVNGVGALGEALSTPIVARPGEGYTQTFIGIGAFDSRLQAENALRYVKTKFARIMLGLLKITQDNNRDAWRMVPIQDFTAGSDIDWSQSIHDIDRQLYAKYGLDEREIDFIETHAKEMY